MALTGGAPRELMGDVISADWGPDGTTMAATRLADGRYRLEYPLGTLRYESSQRLRSVRISPDNRYAAFYEGNALRLIELGNANQVRTLTGGWVAPTLAWSPAGGEVWFSSAKFGWDSTLHAVDLSGIQRDLHATTEVLEILDVAADGRVLASPGTSAKGMRIRTRRDSAERDISWLDWGHVADLSTDGELLLFNEAGSGAGSGGQRIYVRSTDGRPAVELGRGEAFQLSPDKQWVLARMQQRLVLLPTGAGEARPVDLPAGAVINASWFPDGKRAIVVLQESQGGGTRTFITDFIGKATQVGPDQLFGYFVSPESRQILTAIGTISPGGQQLSRQFVLVSPDGKVEAASALKETDDPIAWGLDESTMYVRTRALAEHILWKVSIRDGRREAVLRTTPDPVGASAVLPMAITPDGSTYAYTVAHHRRNLQLISGLR